MIYCCKQGHCIALYGDQQRHCAESITDHIDQNCHMWLWPNKCGIAHIIDDKNKVDCKCANTMKTFELIIPQRLPGLNEIIKWSKTPVPWLSKGKRKVFQYSLQKREIEDYIRSLTITRSSGFPDVKFNNCRIDFKWYEPNRRRDPSNVCAGGRKFILDALVGIGVLKNDNWKVKDFSDEFFVDKENPRVEIRITEV